MYIYNAQRYSVSLFHYCEITGSHTHENDSAPKRFYPPSPTRINVLSENGEKKTKNGKEYPAMQSACPEVDRSDSMYTFLSRPQRAPPPPQNPIPFPIQQR